MHRTSLYRAAICGLSLLALLLQTGIAAAGNWSANGWQPQGPDDGSQSNMATGNPAGNGWDNSGPDQYNSIQQTNGDPTGNGWSDDWWNWLFDQVFSHSPWSGSPSAPPSYSPEPSIAPSYSPEPSTAPPSYPSPPPVNSPEPSTIPTNPSPSPSMTPKPSPSTTPQPSASGDLAGQLADSLNAARARQGLAPLTRDPGLDQVASHRSQDMATRHYFSHTTPDGTTVFDELNGAGIVFTRAGEIIAENTYPVDQAASVAATGLLNSPGHRAIILDPNYTKFGVGEATDSNGMQIFTGVYTRD